MLRRLQVIGFFKVRILKEETTHFWHKEQNKAEDKQEYRNTYQVMHSVKRMEGHAIQRHTIFIFVLFDFHAVRVV